MSSDLETSSTGQDVFQDSTTLPKSTLLLLHQLTIDSVRRVIKQQFGDKYSVECFGSVGYGVDTPSSDLDLVILDPEREHGFCNGEDLLPPIYDVRVLARVLKTANFTVKEIRSKAPVQIVKFLYPITGIECDINVNHRLGLYNTAMIARYCDLAPILRPLIMAIKRWAKPNGLNNPSGQDGATTFSSYALALMAIGVFQIKGRLPTLQEGLPSTRGNITPDTGIFWRRAPNGEPEPCDFRFNVLPQLRPIPVEQFDLRQLLIEWFQFWGSDHRRSTTLLSIRHGGLVARTFLTDIDQQPRGWNTQGMVVADPFIPKKNVTSSVSKAALNRFSSICIRSATVLEAGFPISAIQGDLRTEKEKAIKLKGVRFGGAVTPGF